MVLCARTNAKCICLGPESCGALKISESSFVFCSGARCCAGADRFGGSHSAARGRQKRSARLLPRCSHKNIHICKCRVRSKCFTRPELKFCLNALTFFTARKIQKFRLDCAHFQRPVVVSGSRHNSDAHGIQPKHSLFRSVMVYMDRFYSVVHVYVLLTCVEGASRSGWYKFLDKTVVYTWKAVF